MTEKNSLVGRSFATLKAEGLKGLTRQAALYFARRVAGRSAAMSQRLDYIISRDHLLREYGPVLKRNEVFRDRHKGRRCFVIGNGPSLREQDLSWLRNEITLVTNSFYRHPIIGDDWQPSYYFLSDPEFFKGTQPLSLFSELTAKIPSAPFFVPFFGKDFLVSTGALPPERTYFVATWGGLEEESWREKPDLTKVTPGMMTVAQLGIMAAMYMGCTQIYLLGMDHDWLSHGGEHVNFYSSTKLDEQTAGNINGWRYKPLMEAMLIMWQLYEKLGKMADAEGIKIINATRGGFLDVFERGNYDELEQGELTPDLQVQSQS